MRPKGDPILTQRRPKLDPILTHPPLVFAQPLDLACFHAKHLSKEVYGVYCKVFATGGPLKSSDVQDSASRDAACGCGESEIEKRECAPGGGGAKSALFRFATREPPAGPASSSINSTAHSYRVDKAWQRDQDSLVARFARL
jgi:hypothetical protein